jgi:endoribonuclease Dicer
MSLLKNAISRPQEQEIYFQRLMQYSPTDLCQLLSNLIGKMALMSKSFRDVKKANYELGPWCANRVWFYALAEHEAEKLVAKLRKLYIKASGDEAENSLDFSNSVADLKSAINIVTQHPYSSPKPTLRDETDGDISTKVLELFRYVHHVYSSNENEKCIIFVEKRITARLLLDLFQNLDIPNIKLGTLIGSRDWEVGDSKVTYRQQMETIVDFKAGKLNCLVDAHWFDEVNDTS